jgi:hypothetical protein
LRIKAEENTASAIWPRCRTERQQSTIRKALESWNEHDRLQVRLLALSISFDDWQVTRKQADQTARFIVARGKRSKVKFVIRNDIDV